MSWEAVEPPNRYVSKMSGDSITGVVKLEDRIVFLLDLEKIVADLNPNLGLRLDMSIEWHSATRYRALVADDSVLVREMLKDLLQKAGFDVTAVQNGREAWDLLLQIKGKVEAEKRPVTDYVQVMVAGILGIGFLFGALILRTITKPLKSLVTYAGDVSTGNLDAAATGTFSGEMGTLQAAIEAMVFAWTSKACPT